MEKLNLNKRTLATSATLIYILFSLFIANIHVKAQVATLASTELINFYSRTPTQMENFVHLCVTQNITLIIARLNAMSEGLSGTSPGITPAKSLITIANDHGIDVAIDLHTWHSTSNPSTNPCTWDDGFDDSYSGHEAVRDGYLTYVTNVLTSFAGSNVYAFMVLNEPQAQTASTDENNFILEVIATANAATVKPISVRFMGGYSPSTGHYASSIDVASDFLCRNTYWDARYPSVAVYGTTEAKLLAVRDSAHGNSKEFWVTEFGKPKSNLENQRSYIEAFVAWANSEDVDAVFAWASQYASTGESYNLFSGTTPNPAWYELVNQAEAEPPPGDNLVELNQPNNLETFDSYTVKFNYTATFYQGTISNSSLWANKTGTWQRLGWNATKISNATMHTISYTFTAEASYVWNVQVFNSTDAHWATANRTFTIETTPPPDDPPTYGDTSVSTTIAGTDATFGCLWMDDNYLSYGMLSHNASAVWANRTSVAIFAPRYTFTDSFTLPASEGVIVGYRFYANDTAGQWNVTAIMTLTTTPAFSPQQSTYYLPQGKSLWIPAGVTRYLGTAEYVGTSVALTLSVWQLSNWVNFTVTSSGTQTICANASNKPTYIAIDGAEAAEGSGWSWSGGVTTLNAASSAAISFTYTSAPPIVTPPSQSGGITVQNTGQVLFIALLHNRPADGAKITVYQLPYNYYYKTLWTNGEGKADITLPWGNYNFTAEYKEYKVYGTIYHTTSEVVTIEFDTGKVTSQPAFTISGWYVRIGLLAFVVCVAVLVIVSVSKRRW